MKNHVAKVLTLETAWKLVAYLEGQTPFKFMVVLLDPATIEVWPAVGNPLRKVDGVAVAKAVRAFKGSLPTAKGDSPPR